MNNEQPQGQMRMHPELETATSICQHAGNLISDMAKAGSLEMGEAEVHVERAFAVAIAFEKRLAGYMTEALDAVKVRVAEEAKALDKKPSLIVQP